SFPTSTPPATRRASPSRTLFGLEFRGAKRCWPSPPPPRPGRTRRRRPGPGHADHERAVAAEVSRPPLLIRLLQLLDIDLELLAVEAVELGFVIAITIHGVACGLARGADGEGAADDRGGRGRRGQGGTRKRRCARAETRGVSGGRTHTAPRWSAPTSAAADVAQSGHRPQKVTSACSRRKPGSWDGLRHGA